MVCNMTRVSKKGFRGQMRDYQMRTTTLLMRGKDIWGQMWQRMDIDTHIAVMQNTQQIVSVEDIQKRNV